MSEQNEKLTAEEIQKVLHAAYLRDGEPTSATITYLHHLFQSKAAQQVEHATAELRKEIEQLKEWKRQHLRITTPLFDYGQSKEAGLPVGSSIVQEAIKAMKECAELRKELERQKEIAESLAKERWSLRDELSEAQRQRDEAVKELKAVSGFLLHKLGKDAHNISLQLMCDTIESTISRLSSGETKLEFKCVHGLPSEATCIDCLDDSHKPPPESLTDKK